MNTATKDDKTPRPHDVFVSYSRKDKEIVRRLDEALRQRKREAWVDWDDLRPAEEFMQAIYGAIERANAFVFVLTPSSLASEVCGREIAHAVAHNKRLIPLVARDVEVQAVPKSLAALNWIFCRESDDFDAGIDTLISALDTDLGWVRHHTRLLTRALEWKANGNSSSFALRGEDLQFAEMWLAQAGAQKERQPTELQTEYILASRKAATRRQRITLGAVSFGFIVALVLAIVAVVARQKAVKEEARAVAGRNRADGVIRFVQNNLPDKLRPIGRLDLMADVAVAVDQYYDQMRAAEGESADAFAGKSWAAINQGYIDEQQGRRPDALKKYRTALQLAESARVSDPGSEKALEYEATARLVLGGVLQTAVQPDAAMDENRKARQMFEMLVARDPSNARWQSQLAGCHTVEAIHFLSQKKLDDALAKFRQAAEIQEKLAAKAPKDSERLVQVTHLQKCIAAVFLEKRQFEPALASFRTAQETFRKLTLIDPRNVDWQRNLAMSYKDIGSILQAQGQNDLALAEFQRHAGAIEKIASGDPANATWQREAAEAHLFAGNAFFQLKRFDVALTEFRQGHATMIQLAAANPTNAFLQIQALTTCPQLVIAHVVAGPKGDLKEAAQAVNRGFGIIAALEKLGPLGPDAVMLRDRLKKMDRDLSYTATLKAK